MSVANAHSLARFRSLVSARSSWLLASLAIIAASGCAADTGIMDEDTVEASEQALIRGGSGPRNGFTCGSNGSCECNKSIENDCEDMSAVCSEDTLDGLITCIDGWLTTHCTCTKARASSGGVTPPKGSVKWLGSVATTGAVLSSK